LGHLRFDCIPKNCNVFAIAIPAESENSEEYGISFGFRTTENVKLLFGLETHEFFPLPFPLV